MTRRTCPTIRISRIGVICMVIAALIAVGLTVAAIWFATRPHDPVPSAATSTVPPSVSQQGATMTQRTVQATFNGNTMTIALLDNPAAADLAAKLPMDVTIEDFNGTEKIAYPDEAIAVDGAPQETTPVAGDLTLYAPWGNLAFFYRDFRHSPGLVPLGHVETGAELLSGIADGTVMHLELA